MSRDVEPKAPIWARPEPRGRGQRGGLSRAEIVQTALKIADSEGLAEVSIRRLARELRAGAMSLYHYFDSRDEILDLMGDSVAAEMLVPELPADWREALHAIAMQSRSAFLNHRWLLTTLQDRPRVSPNLLRHIEQSAQSVTQLGEQGHPPELLSGIVIAVDDYTIGYTYRELEGGGSDDRGRRMAKQFRDAYDQPHVRYLLESGEFPMLERFVSMGQPLITQPFEVGLNWLLDGFEASLRR
ncbi:TetR/AcrR family transcriptional regulator C-terminal domain-containing protein [Solirubrobacter ginsenosidimutans]|uniref:TetR/AcrR family transcriptional regulator C-terminal domain-containing protein n=1 Tax=Solirubrobacter ginsenosidimutans TaxID=490573 RepID=A0A9X3N102_9ACTN|nr:TetR/AcrR family transcriptional regulator C-terminal domain-containing protein [Solirubrobacter ginsenosidimutans]MDA0164812.1 TetR/AcrR family transcriptional regulator C-terminal domain-containing protein [Solirubrobacter ginsenosidimutans]